MSKMENIVYVGNKNPMNYVTAIITAFTRSDKEDVVLKARGRAIKTAVDAGEITQRRFMNELDISNIEIGTEELIQRDGRTRNVSTIEITLKQNRGKKEMRETGKTKTESLPMQHIELTRIQGVGTKRAEKLKSHAVYSVQDLVKLDPKDLSEKLQISEKRALKWVDEAKVILRK